MNILKPYISRPCRTIHASGRLLHVPEPEDRSRQRELYEQVWAFQPVIWRPEQIHCRIRSAIESEPGLMALRTDIRNCFGSLPQELIVRRLQNLPLDCFVRQSLIHVVHSVPGGIPVGSPLSSWLAELILRDLDRALAPFPLYFRYVDDLCVLGSSDQCIEAKKTLQGSLAPMGMSLNLKKTCILPAVDLTFLGASYQPLAAERVLEVNLGGDTFQLPNHKHVHLRVDRGGRPYQENNGSITYSLSCMLNRLSKQPPPYVLEMLILRPACPDPILARLMAQPALVLDRNLPAALHHKIYRHYVTQVRQPVDRGLIPIGAAGEVFRWLHLTNHIMSQTRLPENYSDAQADWMEVLGPLERGEFEPYHRRIKALFKDEYRLRTGPSRLPDVKPALAMFE